MVLYPLKEDEIKPLKFPERITGVKKVEEVIYRLFSHGDGSTNLFLVYTEHCVFCWNDRSEEIIAQANTPEEIIGKIIDLFEQEDYLGRAIEILEDYKEEKAL
jgi:hypothetical protein